VPVDTREDQAGQWVLRRVASNGVVSVDNQMFSVGNAYRAELVDVFVEEATIQVWSKNHLIKTVARTRSGPVRKIRADRLHVKDLPDTKRQASGGT
jgi:Mu transposase, C-terminal domain